MLYTFEMESIQKKHLKPNKISKFLFSKDQELGPPGAVCFDSYVNTFS